MHIDNGKTEMWWGTKETDLSLMSAEAWRRLGAKPFEDDNGPEKQVE